MFALPLFIQIRGFVTYFRVYDFNDYANITVTVILLLLSPVLLIIQFCKYPPSAKRYSVAYGGLKSERKFAVVLYLVNYFRPYILSLLVVFVTPYSVNGVSYAFLGVNGLHFLLVFLNVTNFTSKVGFALRLAKSGVGLFITIILQISDGQDSVLVLISAYLVLLIMFIELF